MATRFRLIRTVATEFATANLAMANLATASLATLLLATAALGQSPALPAPGGVGTGPRTDIQVGPNGTIDVGGARGGDLDLTGGNLRGVLGAARVEPSPIAPPGLPATASGAPVSRLPGAADFGAGLGLVPRDRSLPADQEAIAGELRGASIQDLILPRFRSTASGAASSQASATADWRY